MPTIFAYIRDTCVLITPVCNQFGNQYRSTLMFSDRCLRARSSGLSDPKTSYFTVLLEYISVLAPDSVGDVAD